MPPSAELRIRWAPKVPRVKIRLLYQQATRGVVDDALVDDVGLGLYLRCRSIIMVTEARCVPCPRCGTEIVCAGPRWSRGNPIVCPACSWRATYGQWRDSWRHRDLYGGNAMAAFRAFVAEYPAAASQRERLMLIDRLISAVHRSIRRKRVFRSAAHNLIEGSIAQVLELLDELATDPGISASIPPPALAAGP